MNKKIFIIIAALLIAAIGVFSYNVFLQSNNKPEIGGSGSNIELEIQKLVAKKYDKPVDSVSLYITNQKDGFVAGTRSFGQTPGLAGRFLARNVSGAWELNFEGNGLVDCKEIRKFGYPEEVIKPWFCD